MSRFVTSWSPPLHRPCSAAGLIDSREAGTHLAAPRPWRRRRLNTYKPSWAISILTGGACLIAATTCFGQLTISSGPDVNIKLGVLGQFQGDTIDEPVTDSQTNNLFVRRLRLLAGGQVAPKVTFFIETDAPNLGRRDANGKNISPSLIVQDALATFRATDAFMVDAGLMFIPFSRNSVQSAATLLPIDYGAFTFTASTPTQSATGRDTGFQARGYLLEKHLEYRAGAFQGARDAVSSNAFRYAGRVQYNVFDVEDGYLYSGTYLGKKRILAIGGGFDTQKQYHAWDADVFLDRPLGPAGALTAQFDYNRFDGQTFLTSIPKQNDVLLEVGYLITAAKITPFLQFASKDVSDTAVGDDRRLSVGVNYWWAGHNANIKGAYTHLDTNGLPDRHEWTIQFQFFYF